MFDKLNFEELAEFYGSLFTLEKHYGKEAVQNGLEQMAERLDKQKDVEPKQEWKGQNLELVLKDIEPMEVTVPSKESFTEKPRRKPRKEQGYYFRRIHEFFKGCGIDPEAGMINYYYKEGMTQAEIGKLIGVDQRAVSRYIRGISQQKRREVLSGEAK